MKKAFVGLSGGVDSAVSAALLKERGFDVAGVFIKIWQPEFIECTWRQDRLDAMRVAAHLEIPFREIDLSEEYKRAVVSDMIAAYRSGRTPNPDVLCNKHIKFGSFLEWARTEGADCVATGHYARVIEGALHRGVDRAKDQSYFLYRVSSAQLAHILFPVGEYQKPAVRALAERFALPVAKRPDSQGLCFVGDVSLPDFLARFIPLERGAVLDEHGAVVGAHDGAALYTIGQRHGFTVKGADASVPHFVISIDAARNTITVARHRDAAARRDARVEDLHWIAGAPDRAAQLLAQARYREAPVSVTLSIRDGAATAQFETPHIVSPGQSLVLYDDDRCLGGCTIAA